MSKPTAKTTTKSATTAKEPVMKKTARTAANSKTSTSRPAAQPAELPALEAVRTLSGDELHRAYEAVLGETPKPKTPVPVLRSKIIAELKRRAAADSEASPDETGPTADAAQLDEAPAAGPATTDTSSSDASPSAPADDSPAGTSQEPNFGEGGSAANLNTEDAAGANDGTEDAPGADDHATGATPPEDAPRAPQNAQDDVAAPPATAARARDLIDMTLDRARTLEPSARKAFLEDFGKKELIQLVERATGQKTSGRLTSTAAIDRILKALAEPTAQESPAAAEQPRSAGHAAAVPAASAAEGDGDGGSDREASGTPDADDDKQLPPVGTLIQKKDRRGKVRCECTVVEGGVAYNGKNYSSISAAALAAARDLGLTTKTLNGWTWWQLTAAPRPATGTTRSPLDGVETAWERYLEKATAAAKAAEGDTRTRLQAALARHATALQQLAAPLAPATTTAAA